MALINYANKEINAKIVYYGPGLSGKTTNIQYIFQKLKPEHRGKLITLPTQTDRTLFFDFLPVEIPDVKGFTTRFHLYTVPGQVFYNATRKMVLKGVDGIVFVADSQKEKLDDNLDSLKNLEENLNEYGKSITSLPFVLQYNKRDLPSLNTTAELNKRLNQWGYPFYETIATNGKGVMETLSTISRMVLRHLKESYESQKILKYGASRAADTQKEEIIDKKTAEVEEKPVQKTRATADFTQGEVIDQEEMLIERSGDMGRATGDNLGVMGEFEETSREKTQAKSTVAKPVETSVQDDDEITIDIDDSEIDHAAEKAPNDEKYPVDLMLGGEVERVGPALFRIPLTFRVHDTKKDIVITISLQITDSNKDRDIF